jgi:methyl-accepting chemotaxis protein
MKTKNLALKVTLNSFIVILVAFGLLQAYSYIRDALLLGAGSFDDFFSSFSSYIGTRVAPVLLIFAAIIFIRAYQIEKRLKVIETGIGVDEELIAKTTQGMRNFKNLIFSLNLLGFAIGYFLDLILLRKLNTAFELNRMMQLFFNLSGAMVYTFAQNSINNILFSGPRELLQISSTEGRKKDPGIRRRNITTTLFIAAYAMIFFYTNHSFAIGHEELYATTLERGINEDLSLSEIEHIYKQETSNLLASKSSRLQLTPEQITFPMDQATSLQRFNTARNTFILLFFVIIAIAFGVQYATSSESKNQLKRMILKMKDILEGDGDLTQRIAITWFDEIGELSDHINRLIVNLGDLLIQVSEVATQVEDSSESIQTSLEQASGAAEEMYASAEHVKENTDKQQEIAEEANEKFEALFGAIEGIVDSVDNQATFIEETSGAIEEMAANIRSVSEAAERANKTVSGLENVADEGGESVNNTISSIREIEDASGKVSQIVGMIQDMNEQTNLLAMNAAIEAAHAGQEGKGFAVVASEVKGLAENGTEQAKQIISYVDTMSEKIGRGVELSDQASAALAGIATDTKISANIVQEISDAMREQSAGASQIVDAVESVVAATQSIKQKTIAQDVLGKQLQKIMEQLASVAKEINESAGEQIAGDSKVVNAVHSVSADSDKNRKATESLKLMMSRFKLS